MCVRGRRGAWRTPATRGATGVAVLVVVASACGTTDEASRQTLPPLVTTTSTVAPSTTAPEDAVRQFYEIQPGDSLAEVALRFEVPLQAIIELNGIENPDSIPVGLTVEIPQNVVLVTELPDIATTTVAP